MVHMKFIEADGTERAVDVEPGTTVMQAALYNDVKGIDGDCGGAAACATCHVYVAQDWLAKTGKATSETERTMLEFTDAFRENSRLGCQIPITEDLDGLIVQIPEFQY